MLRGRPSPKRQQDINLAEMVQIYKKIIILGGPGAGKTYLAQHLSNITRIPIYHTDYIRRGDRWADKPLLEIENSFKSILLTSKWIIEGNCRVCLLERIQDAELVIILNFSKWRLMKNVLIRMVKNFGKPIPECPQCKEHFSLEFLKYTWTFTYKRLPQIETMVKENCNGKVICFLNWKKYTEYFEEGKF